MADSKKNTLVTGLDFQIELSDSDSKIIGIKNITNIRKRKEISILVVKTKDGWIMPDLLIHPKKFASLIDDFDVMDDLSHNDLLENSLVLCNSFVQDYIGDYPDGQYAVLTLANNKNGFVRFKYDDNDSDDEINLYTYSLNRAEFGSDMFNIMNFLVDLININNETIFYADVYLTDLPIADGIFSHEITNYIIQEK